MKNVLNIIKFREHTTYITYLLENAIGDPFGQKMPGHTHFLDKLREHC